jgi:hypothetical protein
MPVLGPSLSSLTGLGSPPSAYPGLAPWAAFCRRFAAGAWWFVLSASLPFLVPHPPGLKPAVILAYAALKRRSSTVVLAFVVRPKSRSNPTSKAQRQDRLCTRPWFPLLAQDARNGAPFLFFADANVKSKVKGNGWECPFHAGNVNFKGGAAGVCGSHPCAKCAQGWGTLGVFGERKSRNQRQHQRQERCCTRSWFPLLAQDARNGAPSAFLGRGSQTQRQGQRTGVSVPRVQSCASM